MGGPGEMSVVLSCESSLMHWLALALSGQNDNQSWLGQNVVGLEKAAGGAGAGPSGVVGTCGHCCDGIVSGMVVAACCEYAAAGSCWEVTLPCVTVGSAFVP